MSRYTQTQLLNTKFPKTNNGILDGMLNQGLYILSSGTKIGKSMVCTDMANSVAEGKNYLRMSNKKGKVFYFENDNYKEETQERLLALALCENDDITYLFEEDADSFASIIRNIEKEEDIDQYSLVIIDSIANLKEYIQTEDSYKEMYNLFKTFRDYIVSKHLTCIALHHNRKGESHGQDSLIGSKALSGSSTGIILLNVKDEFSVSGTLDFILRNEKIRIPIKKDYLGISWMYSEDTVIDDNISRELLQIIKTVVRSKDNRIEGKPAEIAAKCDLMINPAGITKYLKRNKDQLNQNDIYFDYIHKHNGTNIVLECRPKELIDGHNEEIE